MATREEIEIIEIGSLPEASYIDGLYTPGIDGNNNSVKVPINLLKGNKGDSPVIGPNGNWWISGVDTGQSAQSSPNNKTVFNVSSYNNKYDYINLAEARSAIPANLRGLGQIVTYQLVTGEWISERYVGSDTADWSVDTNWSRDDYPFINVTESFPIDPEYYTLESAIESIPSIVRVRGLVISFEIDAGTWRSYRFISQNLENWSDINLWVSFSGINNTYITQNIQNDPDEEDLTVNTDNKISFKNRTSDAELFTSIGYVFSEKNIIDDFNTLVLPAGNTIYEIRYDYDLKGQVLNIPDNVVLKMSGGTISNGTLNGNNTIIQSVGYYSFKNISFTGTFIGALTPIMFGAKKDGVTNDYNAFQVALDACPIFSDGLSIPLGTYVIEGDLDISSNTKIEGNLATIVYSGDFLFTIPDGGRNVSIRNLHNISKNGTENFFKADGYYDSTDPVAHQVRFIDLYNVSTSNFNLALHLDCARRVNITNCNFSANKGLDYLSKTAEVNITNSFFIKSGISAGSYGIRTSRKIKTDYPEGLSVTGTLFYMFEFNLDIQDMFVAFFDNCYFDAEADNVTSIRMGNQNRNYNVTFSNCWLKGGNYGIYFNPADTSKSNTYRCLIKNCFFDNITSNAVHLANNCSEVNISGCFCVGSTPVLSIFFYSTNNNHNITVSDCYIQNCTRGLSVNGANGANNYFSNIYMPSATHYFARSINANNVAGYYFYKRVTIPDGTVIDSTTGYVTDTVNLQPGIYEMILTARANITTAGYIRLYVNGSTILTSDYNYINGTGSIQIKVKILVTTALTSASIILGSGGASSAVGTFTNNYNTILITKSQE